MNFGGSAESERSSTSESGTQTRQLELDDAAIAKIIEDVLSGPSGLASIFGGEQNAGIFDSSVAAQASGDLAANIVGELAKITGREVTNTTNKSRTSAQKFGTTAKFDLLG